MFFHNSKGGIIFVQNSKNEASIFVQTKKGGIDFCMDTN